MISITSYFLINTAISFLNFHYELFLSIIFSLSAEVEDFASHASAAGDAVRSRLIRTVASVRAVVTQLWHGKIRLELFGSVSTGLYLPSSDVDAVLVVCDPCC